MVDSVDRAVRAITRRNSWLLVLAQLLVAVDNAVSPKLIYRMWHPVRAWERGERDTAATVAAWRALATRLAQERLWAPSAAPAGQARRAGAAPVAD